MRIRTVFICLVLVASSLTVGPAAASITPFIWVGENIDVHQNIPGAVANDFHIEGIILSAGQPGTPYVIGGPTFGYTTSFVGNDQYGRGMYKFTADWSGFTAPNCTVLHLGIFFPVDIYNAMLFKKGWWTSNGTPIGNWPVLGFDVPTNNLFRLQGAQTPVTPLQIDMLLLNPPSNVEAMFNMLNVADSDQLGTWITVPFNIPVIEPESFFDIFLDQSLGSPIGPGQFLLTRTLAEWQGPDGLIEQRWFFDVHEQVPVPSTLLLMSSALALLALYQRRR